MTTGQEKSGRSTKINKANCLYIYKKKSSRPKNTIYYLNMKNMICLMLKNEGDKKKFKEDEDKDMDE